MIKKLVLISIALVCFGSLVSAQNWTYVQAENLTMIGKLFPDTPNPFHRIDTDIYGGFSDSELNQVHMSAGIGVAFRTDSPSIVIKTEIVNAFNQGSSSYLTQRGFDLYVKKNGKWLWAGVCSPKSGEAKGIIHFNDAGMSDCIVYFPMFAELRSVEIGVKDGYTLEAIENPFKYRIAVFGSSFTHGYGTSRPGMCWPSQLMRMTGLQFLNLGCSGNSKLQPYFAEALADAQVDAYVFDGFSNPSADIIAERLFPFIETIQAKNPGKPLIFLKSIYREWRNFNSDVDRKESEKAEMAEAMMKKAMRKYKDVYFVTTTNATSPTHETTVDGTHPGDYGYTLWAESVKEQILAILAKYGNQIINEL